MQPVIYPVDKEKLISELTEDKFLRKTNKANNEIYTFNTFNAPNLMREVGRIRELTFRSAGGGTGKEIDIDEFDIEKETPYQQLIVWDPKEKEIIGGYSQTIPKIVKRKEGFASHASGLIKGMYKRTSQLNHLREIMVFKFLRGYSDSSLGNQYR